MEQEELSPRQALSILDGATDPRNAGKLTRIDFCNIQAAFNVLDALVKESESPPEPQAE